LPGKVNVSVQFVIGEPRLVTEMLAVKPPDHELEVYETWHPLAAAAGWVRTSAAAPVVMSTAAAATAGHAGEAAQARADREIGSHYCGPSARRGSRSAR
jgi:hypothetical protein